MSKKKKKVRKATTKKQLKKKVYLVKNTKVIQENKVSCFSSITENKELSSSEYWGSEEEKNGFFRMLNTFNIYRLLVPESQMPILDEMKTGKYAVLSFIDNQVSNVELMFEDFSKSPFFINLQSQSVTGFPKKDCVGKRTLEVYSKGCKLESRMDCHVRIVKSLPCLDKI